MVERTLRDAANTLFTQLGEIVGEKNVKQQEPMSAHTSFRVGGPADFFVSPGHAEEVAGIIELCSRYGMPCMVVGNGSNLLVGDLGIRAVVVQLGKRMSGVEYREVPYTGRTEVTAQAGILMAKLVSDLADKGLTGLEPTGGIPGSLGGGVAMNAGAYGTEIADYMTRAVMLDRDGTLHERTRAEMKLSYRHSLVQETGGIILAASFLLEHGDAAEIRSKVDSYNQKRREKQPLEYPSAGSAFKRPEGYFAGKLIMEAGLAGFTLGGAQVSEKHCGFVINKGNATAAEIAGLMHHVADTVRQKTGVTLEPEVRFVGEGFRWKQLEKTSQGKVWG